MCMRHGEFETAVTTQCIYPRPRVCLTVTQDSEALPMGMALSIRALRAVWHVESIVLCRLACTT